MPTQFPTDRDVLFGLLDGLIALSSRLFPEEVMSIEFRAPSGDCVHVTGHSRTTWARIDDILNFNET